MGFIVKHEDLEQVEDYLNKQLSEWDDNFKDMEKNFKALANSDAFKGATADSIRNYIEDFYLPILTAFSQLMLLVRTRFASYKNGYYQIDSDRNAYITEEGLEEVKRQYDSKLRWLYSDVHAINSALNEVADIFDRGRINISEAEDAYNQIMRDADKLKNDIIRYEDEHYNSAFKDIEDIMNNLKKLINSQKGASKIDVAAYAKYDVDKVEGFKDLIQSIEVSSQNLEALDIKLEEVKESIFCKIGQVLANVKGIKIFKCIFGGDPVNLNTGNFIYEKEDLVVDSVIPIKFKRFYNSIDEREGSLGSNWCHNYEARLVISDSDESQPNEITFINEESTEDVFVLSEEGKYTPIEASDITLTMDENGEFMGETLTGYKYFFNSSGRNIKQVDLNGNALNLKYENDKLISVKNDNGEGLTFKYDDKNYLKEVADHSGRTVRFAIDHEDKVLTSVINPMEKTTQYEYGGFDKKLIEVKNSNNAWAVKNEFDYKNRVTKQDFPDGSEMSYSYDERANKTTLTEQNGNKITYEHDNRFRNIRSIYSDGEEKFAYNSMNQRTMKIDKLGNCTNIKYDNRGNLTGLVDAEGNKYVITYDSNNKPINIKLNNELKMKNSFDSKGNLIETVDALKRKSSFEYNEMGKPVRITRPNKSVVEMEYDKRGNMILRRENEQEMRCEYDNLNRPIKINDTQYFYNDNSKIEKIVNADGSWEKYKYNNVGKVVEKATSDGVTIKNEYNDMNLLTKIVDEKGTTKLEYDNMWNVSRKIDVDGNETSYKYNQLNKLEEVKTPKGTFVLEHDAGGNITSINSGEDIIKLKYDGLNRPIQVTDPVGTKTNFAYDAMGAIKKITDAFGVPMELDPETHEWKKIERNLISEFKGKYNPAGIDKEIYSKDNNFIDISVNEHIGGDVFVTNYSRKEGEDIVDGWTINIPLLSKFASVHYTIDKSAFKFNYSFDVKVGSHNVGFGTQADKEGISFKILTSGGSDSLPIDLPDGTEIDPNARLDWNFGIKLIKIDWKMIALAVEGVALTLIIAALAADDISGVGVADNGLIPVFSGLLSKNAAEFAARAATIFNPVVFKILELFGKATSSGATKICHGTATG